MFGWIHESFRQLVTRKYGRETWVKIITLANFEEGLEPKVSTYYNDDDTMRIVRTMAQVLGIEDTGVWEAYGGFLIQYTMESGWDQLLRALAPDLDGFINSLDSLHYFCDHVVYRTKMKGPSFRSEPVGDGSILFHYYSPRSGLYPIVEGCIREVARKIYDTEVNIKVQERKQEDMGKFVTEHVVFAVSQVETDTGSSMQRNSISTRAFSTISFFTPAPTSDFHLNLVDFCSAFPHHICFNQNLIVEHVGVFILNVYPHIVRDKMSLTDVVDLIHPEIPLTYDFIKTYKNSFFVFQLREPPDTRIEGASASNPGVTLKGAMVFVHFGQYIVYFCSPDVSTVGELLERNLFLSDMQQHDSTRDLIMLNQSRMSQVELKKLEETTQNLKKMAAEVESEKQKTEDLLCELMPQSVAESLRHGQSVEAMEFVESTILFTDIVTFTNICALCTPYDVVNLLNDLYLRFDRLIELNEVYKVETIGDAYVVVGGVPKQCNNHAERVLNVAIGMMMETRFVLSPITGKPIKIRAGVHSGAVVAGVVGSKMPRYCLFGNTVNVANQLESKGLPRKIHVSESAKTFGLKTNSAFIFTSRGNVDIKGKGQMFTYFLEKNERKSVWEIIGKERQDDQTIDGYLELHASVDDDITEITQEKIQKLKPKKQALLENGYSNDAVNGMVHHKVLSPTSRLKSKFCVLL